MLYYTNHVNISLEVQNSCTCQFVTWPCVALPGSAPALNFVSPIRQGENSASIPNVCTRRFAMQIINFESALFSKNKFFKYRTKFGIRTQTALKHMWNI
jgi:hypothetical protein